MSTKYYEIVIDDWSGGHKVERHIEYFKSSTYAKLEKRCIELDEKLGPEEDLWTCHSAYEVDPMTKERK